MALSTFTLWMWLWYSHHRQPLQDSSSWKTQSLSSVNTRSPPPLPGPGHPPSPLRLCKLGYSRCLVYVKSYNFCLLTTGFFQQAQYRGSSMFQLVSKQPSFLRLNTIPCVCVDHTWFVWIHPSITGHLGGFHLGLWWIMLLWTRVCVHISLWNSFSSFEYMWETKCFDKLSL